MVVEGNPALDAPMVWSILFDHLAAGEAHETLVANEGANRSLGVDVVLCAAGMVAATAIRPMAGAAAGSFGYLFVALAAGAWFCCCFDGLRDGTHLQRTLGAPHGHMTCAAATCDAATLAVSQRRIVIVAAALRLVGGRLLHITRDGPGRGAILHSCNQEATSR